MCQLETGCCYNTSTMNERRKKKTARPLFEIEVITHQEPRKCHVLIFRQCQRNRQTSTVLVCAGKWGVSTVSLCVRRTFARRFKLGKRRRSSSPVPQRLPLLASLLKSGCQVGQYVTRRVQPKYPVNGEKKKISCYSKRHMQASGRKSRKWSRQETSPRQIPWPAWLRT